MYTLRVHLEIGRSASDGLEFVSTAFVNGKPALSYNTSAGLIMYSRAVDENGAAWQPPVIVEAQGPYSNLGRYNSLECERQAGHCLR